MDEIKYEGECLGIPYNSYLAGPDGVEIELYPSPKDTNEKIAQVKHSLRNQRDVVRFTIRRLKG